jgi:hypothetical protein
MSILQSRFPGPCRLDNIDEKGVDAEREKQQFSAQMELLFPSISPPPKQLLIFVVDADPEPEESSP